MRLSEGKDPVELIRHHGADPEIVGGSGTTTATGWVAWCGCGWADASKGEWARTMCFKKLFLTFRRELLSTHSSRRCRSSYGCVSSPDSGCNWSTGSTWAHRCKTPAKRYRYTLWPCPKPPASRWLSNCLAGSLPSPKLCSGPRCR